MTGRGLVIIPFIDCLDDTVKAAADAHAQLGGATDVLLIDQGSGAVVREWAEGYAREFPDRVRLWRHDPPLPSLAATWNRALDYAWECGHEDAFVWNNDIRVAAHMYQTLRDVQEGAGLWFTSPVNCALAPDPTIWERSQAPSSWDPKTDFGGPDFSCFLIRRECHEKYRFDERFQPAYHEDGDFHRRMWLGGDGTSICSVNVPYLHYGSRTIHRSEEANRAFAPQFAACRARYVAKWGGEPHHETRIIPDVGDHYDNVGTPGGYLSGKFPSTSEDHACMECGNSGWPKRTGTRAEGRTLAERPDINAFSGCDFCTGNA